MKRADKSITIVIPTFRRPDALRRALDSALAQKVTGYTIRVVVVDNDVFGSARTVCDGQPRVHYVREPRAGVSHARNTGLANVSGRWVFFLDDDMLAERGCVGALIAAAQRWNASVAFAVVRARMPGDSALQDYMKPFFSRQYDLPEGPTNELMGAGGSLLDLSRCDLPSPAFDPALNATGGEDDQLFMILQDRGAVFAWVPSAQTIEEVPEHRATLAYLWKRNFAYGQGPTQIAAERGDRAGIAKWMAVGLAQTVVRAPLWLIMRALGLPRQALLHAQLAQALGKIFWWERFTEALYGETPAVATSRPRDDAALRP